MAAIQKEIFFNRHGFIRHSVVRVLEFFSCATLEQLQEKIMTDELMPSDFYRLRGCGNHRQPGKLVLFLFPDVRSRAEQKQLETFSNLGAGI